MHARVSKSDSRAWQNVFKWQVPVFRAALVLGMEFRHIHVPCLLPVERPARMVAGEDCPACVRFRAQLHTLTDLRLTVCCCQQTVCCVLKAPAPHLAAHANAARTCAGALRNLQGLCQ